MNRDQNNKQIQLVQPVQPTQNQVQPVQPTQNQVQPVKPTQSVQLVKTTQSDVPDQTQPVQSVQPVQNQVQPVQNQVQPVQNQVQPVQNQTKSMQPPVYILMKKLEKKLNGELGDCWWKYYVAGAFWSNISTPINLAITLLSAVTAGQATTTNMLSQNAFIKISIASLIISTLNTFFRPHGQLMSIMDSIKSVNELGFRFETIYYSECENESDYKRKYEGYTKILLDLNKFQQSLSPDQQNFFTDFIYWLFKNYSCLKRGYKWLDMDMSYLEEDNDKNDKSGDYCSPCSSCCKSTCCGTNKLSGVQSGIQSDIKSDDKLNKNLQTKEIQVTKNLDSELDVELGLETKY